MRRWPGGHHGDGCSRGRRPSLPDYRPGCQGHRTYGHGCTLVWKNFQTPEKVDQGRVAVRGESQVTDNGGGTKLVRAEHKAYSNGNKPTEGGLP